MDRRDFLKTFGIFLTVASMPPAAIAAVKKTNYAHFDPKLEYGDVWNVTDHVNEESSLKIREALEPEMELIIPPKYRKKVRWYYHNPKASHVDPLFQRGSVWWKYTP